MKTLKTIVTGSLVTALILFAGSFCLHPMQVQAADEMDMSAFHTDGTSGDMMQETNDVFVSALSTCVSDCIVSAPEAAPVKKASVDNNLSVVTMVTSAERVQSLDVSFDHLDVGGVAPPTPDILSSVMKKE